MVNLLTYKVEELSEVFYTVDIPFLSVGSDYATYLSKYTSMPLCADYKVTGTTFIPYMWQNTAWFAGMTRMCGMYTAVQLLNLYRLVMHIVHPIHGTEVTSILTDTPDTIRTREIYTDLFDAWSGDVYLLKLKTLT